jgi:L-ascorbate metabolism protein UlaG (beta-lactamase superfamily)
MGASMGALTGASLGASVVVGASASAPSAGYRRDADGKFHNAAVEPKQGFWKTLGLFWDVMFRKPAGTMPTTGQAVPVQPITPAQLLAAPDRTLFRLGHSTVLLKLQGRFWLTDPVFSERASPFSFAGPKRFHAPPMALSDLPELEAVILSHDHYDHLDEATVKALAPKVRHFLTPLGVGQRLIDWGVPAEKVQQLDWWQATTVSGVTLTATPAQHFSGRSLWDRNSTLWASWVIEDAGLRIFFSGDTGYFDGFKAIGERFGGFDLTLMETGAYDARWPYVHMQPEQTLQAHLDLRGRRLMPIHNGTFDLAMHRWQDPFERIQALARLRSVELVTPIMGAPVDIQHPAATDAWWQAPV